jgi:hypothetical protein
MLKYCKVIISLIFISFSVSTATAQDTAAMVKEFNTVMSFSVQPYLHYNARTVVASTPVMQPEDTMNFSGEFYKNETNIYYASNREEMFLEDSLFIEINNERKSIWISKVDVSTKDKMNVLPLANKDLQQLFRQKYLISKTITDKEFSKLNFETKQYFDSVSMVIVNVGLQYSGKKMLPQLLEMNVHMKQRIDDAAEQQIKSQGINGAAAVQVIDNDKFFVRTQKVSVNFSDIDNTKEKAMQIPSWKSRLDYDLANNEFSGKGIYAGYEITKNF